LSQFLHSQRFFAKTSADAEKSPFVEDHFVDEVAFGEIAGPEALAGDGEKSPNR